MWICILWIIHSLYKIGCYELDEGVELHELYLELYNQKICVILIVLDFMKREQLRDFMSWNSIYMQFFKVSNLASPLMNWYVMVVKFV